MSAALTKPERSQRLVELEGIIERSAWWQGRKHRGKITGTKKSDKRAHTVYCCYGRDELLYVGISLQASVRLSAHNGTSWWGDVTTIDVEHWPNRESALLRESELIKALRPPFNRTRFK